MRLIILISFLALVIFPSSGFAQMSAKSIVIIDSVLIQGNKHTRDYIILRELDIHPNDTIQKSKIDSLINWNKNRVNNTQLFNSVEVSLHSKDTLKSNLLIKVTERWYIFPNIIFELADRSFNEWWYDRGRDLKRVNYGFRLSHKNFRGRKEEVRINAQFGFTKRYEFVYDIPYIDKGLKNGLSFSISYSDNKQVAFRSGQIKTYPDRVDTVYNKLDYYKSEAILRSRFNVKFLYSRRSKFYALHEVEMGYNYNTINDSIAIDNPNYFKNAKTTQSFFYLTYFFTYDRRDNVVYPLRGRIFSAEMSKLGLSGLDNINQFYAIGRYSTYHQLGKRYYLSAGVMGRIMLPTSQPYYNYRGLGYGQAFVRGYDLYVIDGSHYALAKFTFKRDFLSFKSKMNFIPLEQFRNVPFDFYLKAYFDSGYVWDFSRNIFNSRFSNKLLYGGGIGLDIVTFYSTVIGLDYSINAAGEKNFFFRFVKDI